MSSKSLQDLKWAASTMLCLDNAFAAYQVARILHSCRIALCRRDLFLLSRCFLHWHKPHQHQGIRIEAFVEFHPQAFEFRPHLTIATRPQ